MEPTGFPSTRTVRSGVNPISCDQRIAPNHRIVSSPFFSFLNVTLYFTIAELRKSSWRKSSTFSAAIHRSERFTSVWRFSAQFKQPTRKTNQSIEQQQQQQQQQQWMAFVCYTLLSIKSNLSSVRLITTKKNMKENEEWPIIENRQSAIAICNLAPAPTTAAMAANNDSRFDCFDLENESSREWTLPRLLKAKSGGNVKLACQSRNKRRAICRASWWIDCSGRRVLPFSAVVFCPSRPSLAAPLSISNSFGLFANEVQSPEETCQNQASATDDTVAAGKVEGKMEEALQDVQ